jgi:hypothetical protein
MSKSKNKNKRETKTKKGEFKKSKLLSKERQKIFDAIKLYNDPHHKGDIFINVDKLRVKLASYYIYEYYEYENPLPYVGLIRDHGTFHLALIRHFEDPVENYEYVSSAYSLDGVKFIKKHPKVYAMASEAYVRPKFGEESLNVKNHFDNAMNIIRTIADND